MYQINLIKRNMLRSDYVYTIRTTMDSNFWYFYDFATNENTIVWTPLLSRCMKFELEREVEEFKFNFFKGRKCEIIRFKQL